MSTLMFSVMSPATGTAKGRLSGLFGGLVQAVGTEWRLRRATRNVESLSDEMLHDIGITRGEIDRAVRCGRARG